MSLCRQVLWDEGAALPPLNLEGDGLKHFEGDVESNGSEEQVLGILDDDVGHVDKGH